MSTTRSYKRSLSDGYNFKRSGSTRKDVKKRIEKFTLRHFHQDGNNSMGSISEEIDDTESIISSEYQGEEFEETDQHETRIQEIWQRRDIEGSLQLLPSSQEIISLIEYGQITEAAQLKQSGVSGLLIGAWYGNAELVREILKRGASPNIYDNKGRSPLHLSACSGHHECVELLLEHGAHVNVWNNDKTITPLHCAASAASLQTIKLLVQAGANVDAGLSTFGSGRTPLHYAVQSNSIACIRELLSLGASLNMPQVYTETPLHVAAGLGFSNCVRILLENGADYRVQYGVEKSTPLHLAAEDGNAECAKLLLDAGADLTVTNYKLQTPIHLAALAQSTKTLELLLARKADPNAEDVDKRTPLHSAIVKGSRSCECVQLLLENGAKVNAADTFGYTPVHIAALNEFTNCLKLLIDHGGDVTKKTNGNVTALSFIVRRTPEILQYFEKKFDHSIKLHDHEIGDVDCEIKLDFSILVPNVSCGETCLLLTFIEVGQRRILKHPLSQIFLYLKWRRIRKFFLLSLIVHAIYVFLCSYYQNSLFEMCPPNKNNCILPLQLRVTSYLVLISNLIIISKEIFQIAQTRSAYIYQWENWLQWIIIITVFITLIPPKLNTSLALWQHNISVFGIFFNWLELMVLIGRFPMFGLYVQMFTRVSVNFGKFLLAYCCLLVAFAFSFRMLFPDHIAFQNILHSLVKVVVMMTGELEFEDIFYYDQVNIADSSTGTPNRKNDTGFIFNKADNFEIGYLFFLIFTLLVTVVLTNLLVGLSVSDIQGLQKSAGLDRLVRQVELVAYMESMLFSRLLNWIPEKQLAVCHKSALLLSSPRQWSLILRPNDPREKRIPIDLIKIAYKCVFEQRTNRGRYKPPSRFSYRRRSDGFNHPQSAKWSTIS